MNTIVVIALAATAWILYKKIFGGRSKSSDSFGRAVPGPSGVPILGNLPQLGADPYATLIKYTNEFGPIYKLDFGSTPNIMLNDPKFIKDAYVDQYENFCNRPINLAVEIIVKNGLDMSFGSGETWKRYRRLTHQHLLNTSSILKLEPEILDEIRLTCAHFSKLSDRGEKVATLHEDIKQNSLNIITRLCFNMRVSDIHNKENDVEGRELLALIDEVFVVIGAPSLAEFIRPLKYLPGPIGQGYLQKIRNIDQKLNNFLDKIIKKHKDTRGDSKPRDFLDMLMDIEKTEKHLFATPDDIKYLLKDLVLAGSDTTAETIEWLILLLCQNPDAQNKIAQELRTVIRDVDDIKFSTFTDGKLPYLEAAIKECMRMTPVGLGLPRVTSNDTTVQGYHIPKDSVVWINFPGLGHNPSVWSDPGAFKPERFINNSESEAAFMPFGIGKRVCAGTQLAKLSVSVTAARLLHQFEFSCNDKVPLATKWSLTYQPERFSVYIKRR
jgi:cytochrome P450